MYSTFQEFFILVFINVLIVFSVSSSWYAFLGVLRILNTYFYWALDSLNHFYEHVSEENKFLMRKLSSLRDHKHTLCLIFAFRIPYIHISKIQNNKENSHGLLWSYLFYFGFKLFWCWDTSSSNIKTSYRLMLCNNITL